MSTPSNAPAVIRALVLALGALLAEVDRLSPAAFPDRAAARSFKARLRGTQRLYSAVLGVQRGAPAPVASPEVLAVLREPALRGGDWRLLQCDPAWDGNWTWDCFIAFAWHGQDGARLMVAVNYSSNQSQCYVRLPFPHLGNQQWRLQDLLGDAQYERPNFPATWARMHQKGRVESRQRDGNDLETRGLYLDVPPWQAHVFKLTT